MNDILSYKSIRNSISMFRSGVNSRDKFLIYDEPGYFFWKPIFYFGSQYGLLYPSWEPAAESQAEAIGETHNTAYNFLIRNDEIKRAECLKSFVTLLSDINSKTPWYFKEITGLDEAVNKKSFYETVKLDEAKKQIVITCLSDSIDNRIGTMLDMYRSACYSWQSKREIVPANLRKFDMGIYIFTKPYNKFVKDILGYFPKGFYEDKKSTVKGDYWGNYWGSLELNLLRKDVDERSIDTKSHKYLEFYNCEIDLDSCKFGDSFSVETPNTMEYRLVITYDNCYDDRYNEEYIGVIGDSIITDLIADEKADPADPNKFGTFKSQNLTGINYESKGFINDAWQRGLENLQSMGNGVINNVTRSVQSMLLGNLYHGSLLNSYRDITQGRILSGGLELASTISDKENYHRPVLGNLKDYAHNEVFDNDVARHIYEKTDSAKKPKSMSSEPLRGPEINTGFYEASKLTPKELHKKTLGSLNTSMRNNI